MTAIKCAEEVLAVAEGSNRFMIDAYPKIFQRCKNETSNNVFYNAVSMSGMLTMMWESYPDKKHTGYQNMLTFLRVDPKKEKFFTAGYSEVLLNYQRLVYTVSEASLNIVNKMYTCVSLGPLDDDFLAKVHGNYRCSHSMLSFTNIPAAVEKINDDFTKDTNDLVREVINAEQLTDTVPKIVLVSSFVFRGVWEVPFNPEHTKMAEFTRSNGTKINVQMMCKKRAPGMSYTNFRAISSHACALYFEGFRYCMIVVRCSRNPGQGADLVHYLTSEAMQEILFPDKLIANFKRYHRKSRRGEGGLLVNISMPRFRISSSHILNRPLTEMPKTAFKTARTMSFPAAFKAMPGNGDPSLTHMIQTCDITIDETGAMQEESRTPLLPPRPSWKARPKCVKMNLDRTFYFVLFDYTNNFLIAAGLVDNPNSNQ